MEKVFIYLYPIKEYTEMFLSSTEKNTKIPLSILDECIDKRYRENGYQVIFALYPDKNIFGITRKPEDKIIYTDVLFEEASAIDFNGQLKKNFKPKLPNDITLLRKIGFVDKLVIGGYHNNSCVERLGETALSLGIDTLIDVDMTDLFFNLHKQKDYFKIEEYNPERYQNYILSQKTRYGEDFIKRLLTETYSSDIYGFNKPQIKK